VPVAGEAAADRVALPRASALRPVKPGEGETVLWQGQPLSAVRRLLEAIGFFALLSLLTLLAIELVRPHLSGSHFAGQPNASALPLILAMIIGMVIIIALPVWLRSSARGRARYMLTNRRALVWLGNRIIGEAILFGSEMTLNASSLAFTAPHLWLDWRLKDEGMDRVRFEKIADAEHVARLAEEHGARWIDQADKEAEEQAEKSSAEARDQDA
jgi:hypothetical protein